MAPPAAPPESPDARPGTRVLYSARVEGPDGRRPGFRLAAAVAPPASLRLEVLGPAGGARLVLATEGTRATALLVSGRRYDVVPATPAAFEAWTGLPLGPAALVALLSGRAPCGTDSTRAGDADPCAGLRFHPRGIEATGCSGALENRDGAVLATLACSGDDPRGWPEHIRVELPARGRSLDLRRTDGPSAALLPEALFDPEIPDGFERADLFRDPASPLLDTGPAPGTGAAEAP